MDYDNVEKWRQDEFLLSIGILDHLESHHDPNPFSEVNKRNRDIRSLDYAYRELVPLFMSWCRKKHSNHG